jgi:hypothetical protein
VARKRDNRRFGHGPYILELRRDEDKWRDGFPFDVPAVADIETLELDASVTLLAGENGAGKSTIIESLAAAIGFDAQGGELERSGQLPAVPRPVLDGALHPVLSETRPRTGYFLRAESFFNVAKYVDSGDVHAPDLALYGDVPLHEQSHGQSFLALAANRRAVRDRHPLANPARLSGRAHLRTDRARYRVVFLRRPRCRTSHARFPRRSRALPARRACGLGDLNARFYGAGSVVRSDPT